MLKNLQIANFIKGVFASLIILIGIISFNSYRGVNSIGEEIQEVANYQVPFSNIITELQRDILEEEIFTYKLEIEAKSSQKPANLETEIEKLEADIDTRIVEAKKLIAEVLNDTKEVNLKEIFQELLQYITNIEKHENSFKESFKKYEVDINSQNISNIKTHRESMELELNRIDGNVTKISRIMENLLDKSSHKTLEDEEHVKVVIEIIFAISFIFAIIAVFFMLKIVMNPIKLLTKTAYDLAEGDGDLTNRLPVKGNNEIDRANVNLNNFIGRIQNMIMEIKHSSNETASIANELSSTANSVGHRVEEEAKVIDNTVNGFSGMHNLLEESLQKSNETKENILNANKNLENAKKEILIMVKRVQESSEVETELATKLNQLSSDAENVKGVLTVISDIADQTNLLALNAAIEAARAGEHGRGFAVVADEVRQLAERTQKSLTEINATINVIVQSILDVSGEMNKNADAIQNLATISTNVERDINDTSSVMLSTAKIAQISFEDISKVASQTNKNMEELKEVNSLTNSNARSVEEIATATQHLHQMTEELNKKINEFTV